MKILGLDISGKDRFAYSVVEEGLLIEQGIASVADLLKVIKKHKPEVLAVDSISELMEHGKLIVKALGRLPFNIDVVEITRAEDASLPMEVLVEKYFNVSKGRLDPVETSYFAAMLAERGVGARIKLYEEETVILIKRLSSTSPGGMSRNRYMRNVKHRIRDLADRISRRLNEVGLDYDLFFKEESGDITSAKFVVYARRDIVRKYIKPLKSSDVVIKIFSEPVKSYGSEREGNAYLIVGVDPGIVTGIAIMDINGRVLHTEARRNLSRGESLRRIYQWGIPVIIATDVSDVPDYVKKLAAMCGATLFRPERDLSVAEKNAVVDKLGYPVGTSHERDALAAAYKAYVEYKAKFERLEKDFGTILTRQQLEEAKALVARGKSIAQAVAEVLRGSREVGYTKIVYVPVEKPCRDVDEYSKMRIAALEYEKTQLEKELEELRSRVASLSRALNDSLWRDAKYNELQRRIEDLSNSLRSCEESKEKLMDDVLDIVLGIIDGRYKLYREDEISECRKAGGILCSDISSVEEAVSNGISGVPLKLVVRYKVRGYYIVDEVKRRELAERIKAALAERRIDLRKILEDYRKRLPG